MCELQCGLATAVIPLTATCFAPGAVSSLSANNNTSTMIAFGTLEAFGNAIMRLEVDEVELISGNWSKSGFTIPVCGAHSRPILNVLWAALPAQLTAERQQSAHLRAPCTPGHLCLQECSDACVRHAGDDIGCLMSPNATNVQRITPNISNLHFHANSEHTRDGIPCTPAVPMLHIDDAAD